MTILAQDTFVGRTVSSNSWGTASDGNVWTKLHGINSILSVSSNEGRVHNGFTDTQMLLGSGTATDQEGLVRLALGQSGDSIGLVLRCDATGANYYYSEIGVFANDITIYKVVSGTKTNLNVWVTGLTISNGSFYWMRFQAVGTTLKCRIWADGATEPATWTGSVTDSALASGQYGLFFNAGGSTDIQFDSYQANDTQVGPANNTMSFVDSLAIMDIFSSADTAFFTGGNGIGDTFSIGNAGVFSENLVASDTPLLQGEYMPLENLVVGTLQSSLQSWMVNTLTLADSLMTTETWSPVGIPTGVSDTFLGQAVSLLLENLAVNDLQSALQSWGVDVLTLTDSFTTLGTWSPTLVQSIGASLLTGDTVSWVELLSMSDTFHGEVSTVTATLLNIHPIGSSLAFYQGKTVVPVLPSGVYLVNGVTLDSQPTLCTAPLESVGIYFLVGSAFFLLFDRPTLLTQSLLADGSVVSMTFALANRNMVTAQVQVASTLVSGADTITFAVTCTLLSSLAVPTFSLASSN